MDKKRKSVETFRAEDRSFYSTYTNPGRVKKETFTREPLVFFQKIWYTNSVWKTSGVVWVQPAAAGPPNPEGFRVRLRRYAGRRKERMDS